MHRLRKAALAFSLMLGVLLLCTVARPAHAQQYVQHDVFNVPYDDFLFFNGLNGGAGEVVHLTGTMHIVTTTVQDPNFGLHIHAVFFVQNMTGVGLSTGTLYRAHGGSEFSADQRVGDSNIYVGMTGTSITRFGLTAPGVDNNYLLSITAHFTVNENGVTSVAFETDKETIR